MESMLTSRLACGDCGTRQHRARDVRSTDRVDSSEIHIPKKEINFDANEH